MAIPPFNELRLEKGGSLEDRMQALCEAYARNFEDLYNRYQTTAQFNEAAVLKGSGRVVRGDVSSEGAKTGGSGFTVTTTEAGLRYVVTFTQKYTAPPQVIPFPIAGGAIGGNVVSKTVEGFALDLYGVAITRIKAAFNFVVIG